MEPEKTLCGIGRAETNLGPYLDVWTKLDAPVVAKRLAEFVDYNLPVILKKGKLSNPFWDDRFDQVKQVLEWLREPQTRHRFEEIALVHAGTSLGEELMSVAERLELLHR